MYTRVQSANARGAIQVNENSTRSDEVRISRYDNQVPPFAGPEIDRLYGHLYCSPSYFEIANELPGTSTYVAWKSAEPVAILLYKQCENGITVISDYVNIDQEEIRRFSEYMFDSFKSLKVISFRKLQAAIRDFPYPWHAITCTEDMVVALPPSVKEYETAMGKNMRRNIKRYTNALAKDFPSYRYRLYLEDEVSEQHIRDIIALSCTRMKSKNIVPRFNEEETQWIVDFAKRCGIVGVATIDGRVCAGAIGFRMGENCFMHVIAHDIKYNDYSLGILCYYHTICEGIVCGAKRFHLLQGRYGYKYRLLAERQDLIHLDIYRSRLHAFVHGRRILNKEVKGRIRLMKQWLLHDVERQNGAMHRFLGKMVNALRTMKRSGQSSAIN